MRALKYFTGVCLCLVLVLCCVFLPTGMMSANDTLTLNKSEKRSIDSFDISFHSQLSTLEKIELLGNVVYKNEITSEEAEEAVQREQYETVAAYDENTEAVGKASDDDELIGTLSFLRLDDSGYPLPEDVKFTRSKYYSLIDSQGRQIVVREMYFKNDDIVLSVTKDVESGIIIAFKFFAYDGIQGRFYTDKYEMINVLNLYYPFEYSEGKIENYDDYEEFLYNRIFIDANSAGFNM